MGTKFRLKLVIHDEGTSVRAVMADGKRLILDYENSQARQVRVRAPLIDRDKFIENSKHWLSKGFQSTIEAHVDFRVKGLEKEVLEEIQKIRKSMKRIGSSVQNIKIAKEEFEKYKAKKGMIVSEVSSR